MRKILPLSMAAVVAAVVLVPRPAPAQAIRLVRDAEIERTIRAFGTPLFDAAGLTSEAIGLHIVNDNELNAFVTGGQNMFLTTGLLMRAEHAGQVIGVMAHETGHIAAGHLVRRQEEERHAAIQSIFSLVLGAAAVVAGQGAAGQAIVAGGTHVTQRQLLQYSRSQEAAADQAAVIYLDSTGQSARGMMEFLDVLSGQELLTIGRQDPYVRSHPITRDRVAFVRNHVAESALADVPPSPEYQELFARMQAKLQGFLKSPAATLARYAESDPSIAARYARAIAYYRTPDLARALPLIDSLILERPRDPFFRELKGQMLFENGRIVEAREPYEAAVQLYPDNALLRVGLAQVQLELNDPAFNAAALANLHEAVRMDRNFIATWNLLAIAYGRSSLFGLAALALAEKALLVGDDKEARQQVARAEKLLPKGSQGRLRARDIKRALAAEQ